jgi:SAM-dependent methyltransferase
MHRELINKNNEIYNCVQGKATPNERVLWDDAQKQAFRFNEIYSFVNNHTSSIIDIGCGNGELLPFMNRIGHIGDYVGIDVNKNLISEARNRFPKYTFHLINILEENPVFKSDNVIISGLFNVNFGQDIEFIKQILKKAYEMSTKRLIFNAISTHVNYTDSKMFYIDPSEILRFCIEELSPVTTVKHGYLSHNYTVCIDKEYQWKSINQ